MTGFQVQRDLSSLLWGVFKCAQTLVEGGSQNDHSFRLMRPLGIRSRPWSDSAQHYC